MESSHFLWYAGVIVASGLGLVFLNATIPAALLLGTNVVLTPPWVWHTFGHLGMVGSDMRWCPRCWNTF
jgi:hypothetical protein